MPFYCQICSSQDERGLSTHLYAPPGTIGRALSIFYCASLVEGGYSGRGKGRYGGKKRNEITTSHPVSRKYGIKHEFVTDRQTPVKMSTGVFILWLAVVLGWLYLSKCSKAFHVGLLGGLLMIQWVSVMFLPPLALFCFCESLSTALLHKVFTQRLIGGL